VQAHYLIPIPGEKKHMKEEELFPCKVGTLSKQSYPSPTLEQYLTTLHPLHAFKLAQFPSSPWNTLKHHSQVSVSRAESKTVISGRSICEIK